MATDGAGYDAKAQLGQVKATLFDLHRKTKEPDQPASDSDHCLDLIHQAQASSEAADVAFIAGHLETAREHVDKGLAFVAAAEACLELRSTLPT